jgi:hypothetical protein
MINDRIDRALTALPALVFQHDTLGLRSLLEELHDGAQDDLLADLCSVETAAARWDVSDRRARAHIARLHEKYGIGRQFGGTWLLRRRDIEAHPPDRKYRQTI